MQYPANLPDTPEARFAFLHAVRGAVQFRPPSDFPPETRYRCTMCRVWFRTMQSWKRHHNGMARNPQLDNPLAYGGSLVTGDN